MFFNGNLLWVYSNIPDNNFHFNVGAPSAMVSNCFGEDFMYFEASQDSEVVAYALGKKTWDIGVQDTPPVYVATEDRNWSSPFPCGGAALRRQLCTDRDHVCLLDCLGGLCDSCCGPLQIPSLPHIPCRSCRSSVLHGKGCPAGAGRIEASSARPPAVAVLGHRLGDAVCHITLTRGRGPTFVLSIFLVRCPVDVCATYT